MFPLSGVAVLHGANALGGKKLMQGHTYAGASTLAYLTATEILKTLPNWFGRANTLGCMVRLSALIIFFSVRFYLFFSQPNNVTCWIFSDFCNFHGGLN